MAIRSALRSLLQRYPALARAMGAAARAVGASRLGDRLAAASRQDDEMSVLVAGTGKVMSMWRLGGRDQVARALADHGWRGFEPPLPDCVVAIVRRSSGLFVDVGANTGFYSIVATTAHPEARALAFEPVPEIADLADANIEINRLGRRTDLLRVAVGEEEGTAVLHLPPPQADGTIETSASLESDFKEEIARTFEVPVITLDGIWKRRGEPTVTMIKIDVEGAEPKVLAGARELIQRCRPVVSVEVLGRLDETPLEELRASLDMVDVVLEPAGIRVAPSLEVVPGAPNHLLVPREELDELVECLRQAGLAVLPAG